MPFHRLLLRVTLVFFVLCGCANSDQKRQITIGVAQAYPLIQAKQANDSKLVKNNRNIFEKAGTTVVYKHYGPNWELLHHGLKAGEIDAALYWSKDLSNSKQYFTFPKMPAFTGSTYLAWLKNNTTVSMKNWHRQFKLEDINGLRYGYTEAQGLSEPLKNMGMVAVSYPDEYHMVVAFKEGKVDLISADPDRMEELFPEQEYKFTKEKAGTSGYAVVVEADRIPAYPVNYYLMFSNATNKAARQDWIKQYDTYQVPRTQKEYDEYF